MGKGSPLLKVIAAASAVTTLSGCYPRVIEQPGWTCGEDLSCSPADGRWRDVQVGMTKRAVADAICRDLVRGRIEDSYLIQATSEGTCQTSNLAGSESIWVLSPVLAPAERHCRGVRDEKIRFFFTGVKLSSISTICPGFDF